MPRNYEAQMEKAKELADPSTIKSQLFIILSDLIKRDIVIREEYEIQPEEFLNFIDSGKFNSTLQSNEVVAEILEWLDNSVRNPSKEDRRRIILTSFISAGRWLGIIKEEEQVPTREFDIDTAQIAIDAFEVGLAHANKLIREKFPGEPFDISKPRNSYTVFDFVLHRDRRTTIRVDIQEESFYKKILRES